MYLSAGTSQKPIFVLDEFPKCLEKKIRLECVSFACHFVSGAVEAYAKGWQRGTP